MKIPDRVTKAAARLRLSTRQLEVMLHALGIEHRAGRWTAGGWRNRYYLTSDGCDAWADCQALVAGGWMRSREYPDEMGGGTTFFVTVAAMRALQLTGWKLEQ